jgi:CheY-like chemotaxis protein
MILQALPTAYLVFQRDIPSAIATANARIRLLSNAPIVSIVDDDESVRAAMSSLVRSLGYESCAFCSAEEFLTSPRLHDASCLVTDVQMQGMSGLELQGELAVAVRICRSSSLPPFPKSEFASAQRPPVPSSSLASRSTVMPSSNASMPH